MLFRFLFQKWSLFETFLEFLKISKNNDHSITKFYYIQQSRQQCQKSQIFHHLYELFQYQQWDSDINNYNIMSQIKIHQSSIKSREQVCQISNQIKQQSNQAIKFQFMCRFTSKNDKIYLFLGITSAIIIGMVFPLFSLLWGSMIDSFEDKDEMLVQTLKILLNYIEIGSGAFIVGWVMQTSFMISAATQGGKCRSQYLKAVMAQQAGWFQTQQQSKLNLQLSALVSSYEQAIGEKISNVISNIFLFISGVILALINGWQLSLVLIGFCPFLIYSWHLLVGIHTKTQQLQEQVSIEANCKAQEALEAIKIVKQMNTAIYQINRYKNFFEKISIKLQNHVRNLGWIQLFSNLCFFGIFALGFWYGSQCAKGSNICPASPKYTSGNILSIFLCLLLPAIHVQQVFPSVKSIKDGKEAFQKIVKIIQRAPQIKSIDQAFIPEKFIGVFQFENVIFAYPKDKSKVILNGLTLEINCKNTGIMGPSGTGKSTIFQLMMRLYDPDSGTVLLDGVDLKKLDLSWLRGQISYVSQEPLLFSASIRENLLIGKPAASQEELWSALKKAEIAEFIKELKQGLQSFVGNGGCQLSGGQKQRLAIARALLKDPKVILLDQASSALDNRNQKLIQDTLNKISSEKIIVSIAHRVSTVQNCDQICLIQSGSLSKKMSFKSNKQIQLNPQFQSLKNILSCSQIKHKQSEKVIQDCNNVQFHNFVDSSNEKIQSCSIILQKNISMKSAVIQQTQQTGQSNQRAPFTRILSYAKHNKTILVIGIICAIAHGFVLPSIGLLLARIISYCIYYETNTSIYSQKLQQQCIRMVIVAIVGAFINKYQYKLLMLLGVKVNYLLQVEIFQKLLKMPIQWFDKEQNSPHKIVNEVLKDGKVVKQLFSKYFPHLISGTSSIIFGLTFALYFQWRTALVAIGLMPLFGGVVALQSTYTFGNNSSKNQIYKQSESTLSQSIKNIKTIQSFGCEAYILHRYESVIEKAVSHSKKTALIAGFAFGLSYIVMYAINGIIFYLSSIFIYHHNLEIMDAFSAIFLVNFAAVIAGSNLQMVPSLLNIKVSAINIFKIIDKSDEQQIRKGENGNIKPKQIKGDIQFRNVSFRYSTREEWALKSISFSVKAGERVGLVGASGCGKSTIIQLLLRFYEPNEGSIFVDGLDIKDYDIDALRRHFGIVSQEATLFDETVKYNILYGNDETSDEELNKYSNLLISSQPNSAVWKQFLQQKVGPRGSHISGGQKQRVAIVRTALRHPSVLLLDEATSALDAQNAILVEECLGKVIDNKTVLNVTHNLQGLRQYSHIIVMEKGIKVEQGSFVDLEANKGKLYRLCNVLVDQ